MSSQDFSTPRRDRQQQPSIKQEDAAVGTSMVFNDSMGRSPSAALPELLREQPMNEEMLLRGAHNRIVSKNSREVNKHLDDEFYNRLKYTKYLIYCSRRSNKLLWRHWPRIFF